MELKLPPLYCPFTFVLSPPFYLEKEGEKEKDNKITVQELADLFSTT